MSQRRVSRGPNSNDSSSEQRLVMQLSAAMHHDETSHSHENHHADHHGNATQESNNVHDKQQQHVPGAQHENSELSSLIGSLSNAFGNQNMAGSLHGLEAGPTSSNLQKPEQSQKQYAPPNAHSNVQNTEVPMHSADPATASRSVHEDHSHQPSTTPGFDLANIDFNNLGNMKSSELGLLLNSVTKGHSDHVDSRSTAGHTPHHDPGHSNALSHTGQAHGQSGQMNLNDVNALSQSLGNLGNLGHIDTSRHHGGHDVDNHQHHHQTPPNHLNNSLVSQHIGHPQPQHHPEFQEKLANQLGTQHHNHFNTHQHHFQHVTQSTEHEVIPRPKPVDNLFPTNSSTSTSVNTHGDRSHLLSHSQTTDSASHRDSQFSWHQHIPTAIDPEVSSIQSVLQSLSTGALVPGATDTESGKSSKESSEPQDLSRFDTSNNKPAEKETSQISEHQTSALSTRLTDNRFANHESHGSQTSVSDPSMSQAASTDHQGTHGFNLSDLGSGAEDQSSIDSLRSAISLSTTTSEPKATDPSISQVQPHQYGAPRPSTDFAERALKPKQGAGGVSKPRRTKSIPRSTPPVSHVSDPRTEFNASDTDTLRAIQQALLSAMGPLASSTSLAETLTSTAAAHSTGAAIEARISSKATADTASAARQDSAISSAMSPTSQETGAQRRLAPAILPAKAQDSRISKVTTKKPVSKIVKSTEVDKQKLRDENAARKRKWREVHLMQNKDNDLRLRISKRANEIYGEQESQSKAHWIEEEFERRRQRRILRAGINSIVDAAKARAAKAAEGKGIARTPSDYARLRVSENARTLTQQSKQAASSQLSQLFKSSNAALEPQLHSEKVSVPLAPYMLVSSPKRPPYKFEWTAKDPNQIETDKHQLSVSSKAGSPDQSSNEQRNDNTPDSDGKISVNGSVSSENKNSNVDPTSVEASNKSNDASSTDKDYSAGDKLTNANYRNDSELKTSKFDKAADGEQIADDSKSVSSKSASPSSLTTKIHAESSANFAKTSGETSDLIETRPKHRYSIIGSLKMGAPPNLAAVYRRIRGANPYEYLAQKEAL